jgi:hypothetical protein
MMKMWEVYAWMPSKSHPNGRERIGPTVCVWAGSKIGAKQAGTHRIGADVCAGRNMSIRCIVGSALADAS